MKDFLINSAVLILCFILSFATAETLPEQYNLATTSLLKKMDKFSTRQRPATVRAIRKTLSPILIIEQKSGQFNLTLYKKGRTRYFIINPAHYLFIKAMAHLPVTIFYLSQGFKKFSFLRPRLVILKNQMISLENKLNLAHQQGDIYKQAKIIVKETLGMVEEALHKKAFSEKEMTPFYADVAPAMRMLSKDSMRVISEGLTPVFVKVKKILETEKQTTVKIIVIGVSATGKEQFLTKLISQNFNLTQATKKPFPRIIFVNNVRTNRKAIDLLAQTYTNSLLATTMMGNAQAMPHDAFKSKK